MNVNRLTSMGVDGEVLGSNRGQLMFGWISDSAIWDGDECNKTEIIEIATAV